MPAGDWNYLAGRLNGDGQIDIVETELPISITSIDDNLSAPPTMTGTITGAVKRYKVDGRPIFEPWNTVIIAEASGVIQGMTIYRKPTFTGASWALDQIGLTGYPLGMPYSGDASYTAADPLDIYRDIWEHLQTQANGNLGVTIDDTTSPVRVGSPVSEADSSSGPRKLNWWSTTNLGQEIDNYARETPFDWLETAYWDGNEPHCHIRLGYPIIGGLRNDLRFVLGENMAISPSVSEPDFINGTMVLGAGEGRERVRGWSGVSDGKLRRISVIDDTTLGYVEQANAIAQEHLAQNRGALIVDSIEVFEHPNAPLSAIELGSIIPLYAETPHVDVDQHVRVVGKSRSPQKSDSVKLTVVRSAVV